MPYFKDQTNTVHVPEDAAGLLLLPSGCIEITKEEADAILNPPPTPEQIIESYKAEIQNRLDDFARTRNYNGILSACTYATSQVPKFHEEGEYAVTARDNTWAAAYELLAEYEAGDIPLPTLEDVMEALPVLEWPQS